MASYDGLHIESSDQDSCARAIEDFERNERKRRVRRIESEKVDINALSQGDGPTLRRHYAIGPPDKGWTEVFISLSSWRMGDVADFLSSALKCRVAVFGYQTTVGQTYYRISEMGACVREIWYTNGECIHSELGSRLDVEKQITSKTMASLTGEDWEWFADWSIDGKETIGLPSCEDIAEAIGCNSFASRTCWYPTELKSGVYIESLPRWWFWR